MCVPALLQEDFCRLYSDRHGHLHTAAIVKGSPQGPYPLPHDLTKAGSFLKLASLMDLKQYILASLVERSSFFVCLGVLVSCPALVFLFIICPFFYL